MIIYEDVCACNFVNNYNKQPINSKSGLSSVCPPAHK